MELFVLSIAIEIHTHSKNLHFQDEVQEVAKAQHLSRE